MIKLVAERYIPIKVDRDRRPEIDLRYQVAVNAVAPGQSGWPLTAVLFEGGEVLYGGSFLPVQDRRGQPGLISMLEKAADLFEGMADKGAGTRAVVMKAFDREKEPARPAAISIALVNEISDGMIAMLDPEFGGFGAAPRVQMPYAVELAATLYHRTGSSKFLDVMVKTLAGMERGAIFDRVGGGFHRSANDLAWRLPEMEKLLSYNAPSLIDYLMAYEATGELDFKNAAEATVNYLLENLTDPAGGFYVAQHAATRADDPKGTYYAWTEADFKKAIPPEHDRVAKMLFNFTAEGDVALGPPPRTLLYLAMSRKEAAERLGMTQQAVREAEAAMIAALAAARKKTAGPPVEKAIYVDSCAAAISAMLEAHRVLGRTDARDAALAALDRALGLMSSGAPLLHRLQPPPQPGHDPALAMDHMMLARAATAAFESTGQARYLQAARELVGRAIDLFWDEGEGGFFDVVSDPNAWGYLKVRRRLPNDISYPALNSLASRVLDRVYLHTGEASYRARAETALKTLVITTRKTDYHHGGLGLAIESLLRPATRYVVVGGPDDPQSRSLEEAARRVFDPGKQVVRLDPEKDKQELSRLKLPALKEAFVTVCREGVCSEPARDEAALKQRVARATRAGSEGAEGPQR